MDMEMNYVKKCISLGVHTLNWSSSGSHHNPRKKRTKFLKVAASHRPITKPPTGMPETTDPGPPCTECGKKFWSRKALFGHMRCHPERQWRGINPPANFRPLTEEDHEVATYLLNLANGPPAVGPTGSVNYQGKPEEEEEECGDDGVGGFECSSCKKVFGSHQALGGHRASHKNVKGCYANTKSSDHGHNYYCSRVCGLDLNFPPPAAAAAPLVIEDDDDDDDAAASTSMMALDLRLRL